MNALHMQKDTTTSGILLVDKPDGMTSHDIVNAIRWTFGFSKVGHAGTLDPMATGLLVLLIGKATKLSGNFLNDDKTYVTTLKLGMTTDTGDACGNMLKTFSCDVGEKDIVDIMDSFRGEIEQVPPMFSAKRHRGKKLYQYARKGIEVERKPRKIIKKLDMVSFDLPDVSLKVCCSKGTYIRQLACDIGDALGCGAHLTSLRRVSSGPFSVQDAINFERLKNMTKESVNENIIRY